MKITTTVLLAAVCGALSLPCLHAQEKPFVVHPDGPAPQASAAPAPAANCPPAETIQQLLDQVDSNVSGDASKDFTCLQRLFVPGGRLVIVRKLAQPTAEGQQVAIRPLTIEQYIDVAKKRTAAGYEKQTGYKVDKFGNIAQIWSTYQLSGTPGGPSTARGVNSFQAIYDGKSWHILEVLWQTEDKDNPLPSLPTTH